MTMRILHVIPGLDVGGAEQVVVDLARTQAQEGHRVVVLSASPVPEGRRRELGPQVRVVAGRHGGRWRKYSDVAALLVTHTPVILKADVVHVHLTLGSAVGVAVELLKLTRRRRTPVVVETDHATGSTMPMAVSFISPYLRWRRAAVVPVAHSARPPALHDRRTIVRVITNGIVPLQQVPRPRIGETLRLGSLGLLRPERHPEVYLDLLEAVVRERPAHLTYGGDGRQLAELQERIQRRGLAERVTFAGRVSDKAAFFSTLDAHVSLAVGPDYGLATLEAASTATPCFGVQLSEDFDGTDREIPSHGNIETLARLVLERSASAETLHEMGQRQAAYVRRNHSIQEMVSRYEDLYVDALRACANTVASTLVVVDTSYSLGTVAEWGTWDAVTCRDLDGYFETVITVNPLASRAAPWSDPTMRAWRSQDINSVHRFVEGNHERWEFLRRCPGGEGPNFLWAQVSLMAHLVRTAKAGSLAAVRAGDPLYGGLFGLLLSRLCRVPLVVRVGGNNERLRRELGRALMPRLFASPRVERAVERLVLGRAAAVLPANEDYRDFAVAAGAEASRCTVIRYGSLVGREHFIEPELRDDGWPLLAEWGVQSHMPFLIYVGRLEAVKRPIDVVSVCELLVGQGLDVPCLVVGEGEQRDWLGAEVERRGLGGRVLLVGARSQEWLQRVLPCAAAFVSPLTGRSLTEAALAGAPVAAYDVDWHGELIEDGVTGLLAPYGDVQGLRDCVTALLSDRDTAQRMGAALRRRTLEMMEPSVLLAEERSVYDRLRSGRRSRTSRRGSGQRDGERVCTSS